MFVRPKLLPYPSKLLYFCEWNNDIIRQMAHLNTQIKNVYNFKSRKKALDVEIAKLCFITF